MAIATISPTVGLPAEADAAKGAGTSQKPGASALESKDEKVLKQFESVMLAMLLKQMRNSASEEGLFPGDKSDTLGGMFDTFMADHLAESGGLGLTSSLGEWMNRGPAAASISKPDSESLRNELNSKAREAYQNELSRSGGF